MPFTTDWGNAGFLLVRASGRLSASDYARMEPALDAELAKRALRQAQDERKEGLALLLDLRGWRGWTAGGLLRDLRFDLRHRNSFPKIAVVGDRRWHGWLTIAAKPIFTGKMRYFDATQERDALEWVGARSSEG